MGKHSKRRRRVILGSFATTLVSSAVGVAVVATTSHYNIASLQNNENNNDPAAAPTLHITHHSSSNNNDGEERDDIQDSIVSSSQLSLTTVFSCGKNWRSAQTCGNTLCPSGLNTDCPNGQYCYGGIIPSCTTTTNDDDSGEGMMDEMLKEQSRLEQQVLNDIQERNENDQLHMNKLVCGTSYDHASSTCNTKHSSTSTLPSTQEAIYCPYGSEEEESCPSDMECYIVSCTNDQKENKNSRISLVDEISSWLVQLFHDKQLLLFSTSYNNDEQKEEKEIDSNNSTFEGGFRREGGIFSGSGKVGTLFASSSSEGYALN